MNRGKVLAYPIIHCNVDDTFSVGFNSSFDQASKIADLFLRIGAEAPAMNPNKDRQAGA